MTYIDLKLTNESISYIKSIIMESELDKTDRERLNKEISEGFISLSTLRTLQTKFISSSMSGISLTKILRGSSLKFKSSNETNHEVVHFIII